MVSDSEKKFISLHEAAKGTPYSQDYLRLLIRLGYLQGVKLGRNWFTRKDWISEYLEKYSRKVNTGNAAAGNISRNSEVLFKKADLRSDVLKNIRMKVESVFGKAFYSIANKTFLPAIQKLGDLVSDFGFSRWVERIGVEKWFEAVWTYKSLLTRLAVFFVSVALVQQAVTSDNFVGKSKFVFDKALYSIANSSALVGDATDFLLTYRPPHPSPVC